jgi:hypothetical protein
MMISRYNGVTRNFCNIHSHTLKNTKYRLRTALGESREFYQHNKDTPIHGTGQGSCASPALWLLLSSLLMILLKAHGNGMEMSDVSAIHNTVKETIKDFVDDTFIFTTNTDNN